jgi:hypothetical protein
MAASRSASSARIAAISAPGVSNDAASTPRFYALWRHGQFGFGAGWRYTAVAGRAVHAGMRQSIPSSSIESIAGVSDTAPLAACGHTNLPRSSRLA